MIGIGITTCNRPDHLKWCLDSIMENTKTDFKIYVHEDKEMKGVAYSKNMCLQTLKECDHIFLFDDDCAPKHPDWWKYFTQSGQKHLLYMNHSYEPICNFGNVVYFKNASGVFMYLTKQVIEKVGYFNPDYKRYGFEHAGYSKRIYNAGLSPTNFPVLDETHKFLHAIDLDGPVGFPHYSTVEGEERKNCLEDNNPTYIFETSTRNYYYEFKP